MRTLTIKIEPDVMTALETAGTLFVSAWQSDEYTEEVMSFESPGALFRLFSPARWGVLSELQKTGSCGLRELARRIGCDPSAVMRDVSALSRRGLIEKNDAGQLFVPFNRIHAEFELSQAV